MNFYEILLHKFIRGKCAIGEAHLLDCAFEPVDFVLADTDRGDAFAERFAHDFSRKFEFAVDVMPHFRAVENQRDRVPLCERVFEILGVERGTVFARFEECVEKPNILEQTSFEQCAAFGVLGVFDVQPALFFRAVSIGTKNGFERKFMKTRERILVDKNPVVHAVKQNGFAAFGFDDLRIAQNLDAVSADLFEIVDFPRHRLFRRFRRLGKRG